MIEFGADGVHEERDRLLEAAVARKFLAELSRS